MKKSFHELELVTDKKFLDDSASLRQLRRSAGPLAEGTLTMEQIANQSRPLAEVITAADIGPQADVLDRRVIANFRDYLTETPQYDLTRLFGEQTVTDTRAFKDIFYSDVENYVEKKPQEGYKATYIDVSEETHNMKFYGRLIDVSGEAWKQDREGILEKLPMLLAKAGKRTLMRLGVDAIWTNRNITYTAERLNRFDLALTQTNLETVLRSLKLIPDPNTGEPRATVMAYLVVPVTLEETAKRLLRPDKQTLALQTIAGNVIDYQLDYLVSPMIDGYTTDGWFVFAKPEGDQAALVDTFVRGNKEPELFIRAQDAQKVNGGGMDAASFALETIAWKARLIHNLHPIDTLYWLTAYSQPAS